MERTQFTRAYAGGRLVSEKEAETEASPLLLCYGLIRFNFSGFDTPNIF